MILLTLNRPLISKRYCKRCNFYEDITIHNYSIYTKIYDFEKKKSNPAVNMVDMRYNLIDRFKHSPYECSTKKHLFRLWNQVFFLVFFYLRTLIRITHPTYIILYIHTCLFNVISFHVCIL